MYKTVDTGNNDTGWENDEYRDLLDQAALELDPAKRTALLLDAEAVIMEELPVIPIYYMESIYAVNDHVKNMNPDAIGRYHLKYVEVE